MRAPAAVGKRLEEVDTPALILDLDAFEKNIRTLNAPSAAACACAPTPRRTSAPRSRKRQIAAGAVGVCCQKVSEAEAMVEGGVDDVLVTNEIVGARSSSASPRSRGARSIGVCVDNAENLREMRQRRRASSTSTSSSMSACAAAASRRASRRSRSRARSSTRQPALRRPAGLSRPRAAHAHAWTSATPRSRSRRSTCAHQALLEEAGIDCPIVTGAGSGTFMFEVELGRLGRDPARLLRLHGRRLRENEWAAPLPRFEHALFVLATRDEPARAELAIVDAGLKASSVDSGMPRVWQRAGLPTRKASDEHGWVEGAGQPPALGEKLLLVPGHCDPTVNLYDWYVCMRAGVVEAIWPITARGALT